MISLNPIQLEEWLFKNFNTSPLPPMAGSKQNPFTRQINKYIAICVNNMGGGLWLSLIKDGKTTEWTFIEHESFQVDEINQLIVLNNTLAFKYEKTL